MKTIHKDAMLLALEVFVVVIIAVKLCGLMTMIVITMTTK